MLKRKVLFLMMGVILLAGCAQFGTKTEVVVVTYESAAAIMQSTYVYLSEREKNGSLKGDALAKAKADYSLARAKFIQAGDLLKRNIEAPSSSNVQAYQELLNEVARIAASLQGGK